MSKADDEAQRLEAATAAARELLSEVRGVQKDLRHDLREAREEIRKLAISSVEALVGQAVEAGLDSYQRVVSEAIKDATRAVFNRFDVLFDTLMTGGPSHRRAGEPSLPELIARKSAVDGRMNGPTLGGIGFESDDDD